MNDQAVATLLHEHQPSKPRRHKSARAKKKVPRCRRPRRESTRTITTRLYRMWSEVIKTTFHHKCAVCGEPDSKDHPLNAHHIMPRQNFSGLRFDPLNGIALCPKCHKFGKFSAHKGGIWFADWLHENMSLQYNNCMVRANDELDCKDRVALYKAEDALMKSGIFGKYGNFSITALTKDGGDVHAVVSAHNAKAAEFLFWSGWPKDETPLKGIVKCEKEKPE